MDYISQANVGGTTYAVGLPNMYINNKGNFNIETSAEIGNTSKGKINIESMDDIQLKPGDDIILYSHHRAEDKQDEVAVKVTDGDDVPVKLQLNAAEVVLTTKDKTGNNADVMDVTVNSEQGTRGYLKVRAQAIDLRSESHGGIALQPKGRDGQGNMNKIKFEHGGGDGLEFGTFNAEKTSIFTDEYRFNKDGVWKMATRTKVTSDKADAEDNTTTYKYQKADDDFYDNISNSDATATTEDIIKTASAFNHGVDVSTNIENRKLQVKTPGKFDVVGYLFTEENPYDASLEDSAQVVHITDNLYFDMYTAKINIDDALTMTENQVLDFLSTNKSGFKLETGIDIEVVNEDFVIIAKTSLDEPLGVFSFSRNAGYDIAMESAGDIKIDARGSLKLKGELDFGSTFNFGETDNGIETIIKRTAKDKTKDCGIVKVVAVNNSSSAFTFNTIWDPTANDNAGANQIETTVSLDPGTSQVIAQCSMYDIIKLVNYMKDNNEGPWDAQQ